jgi:hypothetical protein
VRWDGHFMSDASSIEVSRSGKFCVGYGQGGRVYQSELPANCTPLLTREENIYGFQTQIGRGKLVVLGDAGLVSNGLVCFPGFENMAFTREVFNQLTPAWCRTPVQSWNCSRFGHLSASPSKDGMSEELLRSLRPDAVWTDDHHYRHLTWEYSSSGHHAGDAWNDLPIQLDTLQGKTELLANLHWLRIDSDEPGPDCEMKLRVRRSQGADGCDLHIMGQVKTKSLKWSDLCADAELMSAAGEIEEVHTVFEMKIVLDSAGQPQKARWSQGQLLYARSKSAWHYGYEIIMNSTNGVISPIARKEIG